MDSLICSLALTEPCLRRRARGMLPHADISTAFDGMGQHATVHDATLGYSYRDQRGIERL